MELLPCLLPLGTRLCVADLVVDTEAQKVTVELQAIASRCLCSSCQLPAERIHSHYQRTVAHLPWADLTVRLHLLVRKFFCDNAPADAKSLLSVPLPWLRPQRDARYA